MIRIRRKKTKEEKAAEGPEAEKPIEDDSAYVGAYPGKPWDKLTKIRPGKGSRIKVLSEEEQAEAVKLAQKHFGFKGESFPKARLRIQEVLDEADSPLAEVFFTKAIFTEKRIVVRTYLSNAEGRYIAHPRSLQLLKYFADAGLDFEVGAIDYYINDTLKTELLVGDGTEVVSENGYWFSHTHPAKAGVVSNFLPSTQDLDVMLLTARAYAQHLEKYESAYFVLRDIGTTKVTVSTFMKERPSIATIQQVKIEYNFDIQPDESIEAQVRQLKVHLRTRHHLKDDQIEIRKGNTQLLTQLDT